MAADESSVELLDDVYDYFCEILTDSNLPLDVALRAKRLRWNIERVIDAIEERQSDEDTKISKM